MTQDELDRLAAVQRLEGGSCSQAQVACQLRISVRQVKRLWRRYRLDGPVALASKKRGRAPNNKLPADQLAMALERVKHQYPDFGPTFAAQKLAEGPNPIAISHETLRKAMIADGLWVANHRHKARLHPPRDRRPCIGELVQGDGSPHAWFERRGPRCTLICFIDDASSRLSARFARVESSEAYFELLRIYLLRFGRPLSLYVDRHSIFRNNYPSDRDEPTQFGRAMNELGIELICARSPQAKGRVERVNRTLQDRLVKELRLRNISTIEDANAFLTEYLEEHNRRFSVQPSSDIDVHRAVDDQHDLEYILCSREERTLSRDLTFQFKNVIYAINEPTQINRLRHAKIEICKRANGAITVEARKQRLAFSIVSERKLPPILDSKELAASRPTPRPSLGHRPPENHPWKRWTQLSGPPRT